jgi:hypothetical protein
MRVTSACRGTLSTSAERSASDRIAAFDFSSGPPFSLCTTSNADTEDSAYSAVRHFRVAITVAEEHSMKHARSFLFASLLVAVAAAQPLTVYHDSLAAGWQNWSWGTTLNFANGSPVYGGGGQSIAVTHAAAWAGLYLHTTALVSGAQYGTLRFAIHGGASGGQTIAVNAADAAQNFGTQVQIAAPAAGQWTLVEIPIDSFGVSDISGLVWQEAAGHAQPMYFLDEITLLERTVGSGEGPDLSVDAAAERRPISPLIYGMNFADEALAAELRVPVNRWGGNATTRYNWQLDVSNRASDWFFENIPNDNSNPGDLPDGSSSDRFVEANIAARSQTLLTVPLIGWTPKRRAIDGGFSVALYGPQQQVDPWRPDFGNGVRLDGSLITGNDPQDTSIAIGPAFVQDWMNHLIGRYGGAAGGGVRFYNLDNEPMLWNSTHRDVHPAGLGYDESRDRTFAYAAAIKAIDPAAQILGPADWGWSAYFYSARDIELGGGAWWNTRPDRRAHGDVPYAEWYLQQMAAYEAANGQRIVDYLDEHYYPQAAGVSLGGAGDLATQQRRLRSTRSLWDPSYVDESWIGEAVRLIPRMREWVNTRYPGTKLAIGEYNWGAYDHISGALAQADVLGIFGREALDLATLWTAPGVSQPVAFAFRMYRNYDGAGAGFGQTHVRGVSADQGRVSIYAALAQNGDLTIMLINKSDQDLTSQLTLANFAFGPAARVYRYSTADLGRVVRAADLPLPSAGFDVTLPASSISLLLLPPGNTGCAADLNADGVIDLTDLAQLLSCFGLSGCGDVDADADTDLSDLALLLSQFGSACD